MATTCQILILKRAELESLAGVMGHNIRVHENFYRLPEGTLQVAKISKIPLAIESGNISKERMENLVVYI
ncbi:hypothetical protein HOLleu_03093 [Holothuria leucospilota]|uniref:Uncharacterized protein n=1 Tax=Holothuria leucospilota TaxID=206669 RepID=A0A9Q1CS51_HOLLE|nr:hypothetical protein HOLleu_03093 [Holothuria leucospilota]